TQYRAWLEQRRRLANPGTFLWSWVQTHTPEWYTQLLYERPASSAFSEPIGPQPEQIRLLTYTALGVGCRGLGFWSDRFLAGGPPSGARPPAGRGPAQPGAGHARAAAGEPGRHAAVDQDVAPGGRGRGVAHGQGRAGAAGLGGRGRPVRPGPGRGRQAFAG